MNIFLSIIVTVLCMPWPAMIMMSPMMIAAPGFANKKSSIAIAMLFFIYPTFLFLLLYATGHSFYGTNPIWWALAGFTSGSLVSLLYGLPRQFINILKEIANYDYFIKDSNVYLNGVRIKGADAKTFTHYDNRGYYSKDKNHVYYTTKKIKGADAATFRPLENDTTNSYWHDKHHAYYAWKLVPIIGADGASFVYAGNYYTYDKDHVFFQDKLIQEADRTTFKPLADFIGKDAHHVFVQAIPVNFIKDVVSFDVVWINEVQFGRDRGQIYALRYAQPYPLLPFPGADPDTFEVVGEYYAKDKKHVYYYSYHIEEIRVLQNADPDNFILYFDHIRHTDASDGERFYKAGILVH